MQITLNGRIIIKVLWATTVSVLMLSLIVQFRKYVLGLEHPKKLFDLFYVDYENNIPTFFSSAQLFLASLLLALITVIKSQSRSPDWRQWMSLSLIFLYLAADETASIHEYFEKPVDWILGGHPGGLFYTSWVLGGLVAVIGFACFYLKFCFRLPPHTRTQFFTAAAIFLSGALGVELLSGYIFESGQVFERSINNFAYSLSATIEEGLELAGIVVFITALFQYISDHFQEFHVKIDHPR